MNPIYNLRNKRELKSHNVRTVSFSTESFAFLSPEIWDKPPNHLKQNSLKRIRAMCYKLGTTGLPLLIIIVDMDQAIVGMD